MQELRHRRAVNKYSHQKRINRDLSPLSTPRWQQRAAGRAYLAPHAPLATHKPRPARLDRCRPSPTRFHRRAGAQNGAPECRESMLESDAVARRPLLVGGRCCALLMRHALMLACSTRRRPLLHRICGPHRMSRPHVSHAGRSRRPWHRTADTQDRWTHDAAQQSH